MENEEKQTWPTSLAFVFGESILMKKCIFDLSICRLLVKESTVLSKVA